MWNNGGDTVHLYDASGVLVDSYSYCWTEKHNQDEKIENEEPVSKTHESAVDNKQQASTWAMLIKKVYGVDLPDRDVQMLVEPWMVETGHLSVQNADQI